jgi:group I intron endonuclease
MHYLYRITNQLNNKIYIGQSISPDKRWKKHQAYANQDNPPQYISRAMKKYGIENFIFEIISTCRTSEDADEIEKQLITQYDSRNKDKGYNIAVGGNAKPWLSESWRKAMRDKTSGDKHWSKKPENRYIVEETIEKLKGLPAWNKGLPPEQQPYFGKHLSEEHKTKVGLANRKSGSLSEEVIKDIRKSFETQTSKQIAIKFNITLSMVMDIVNYRTYKHIK